MEFAQRETFTFFLQKAFGTFGNNPVTHFDAAYYFFKNEMKRSSTYCGNTYGSERTGMGQVWYVKRRAKPG